MPVMDTSVVNFLGILIVHYGVWEAVLNYTLNVYKVGTHSCEI